MARTEGSVLNWRDIVRDGLEFIALLICRGEKFSLLINIHEYAEK